MIVPCYITGVKKGDCNFMIKAITCTHLRNGEEFSGWLHLNVFYLVFNLGMSAVHVSNNGQIHGVGSLRLLPKRSTWAKIAQK